MKLATNSGNPAKPVRRRSTKDWARRCRIWVVCAWLKAREDRTDDKFDEVPYPKPVTNNDNNDRRRRLFSRMRLLGDDPEDRNQTRGFSIIERFDSHHAYQGCAGLYQSAFWDLIIPPGLGLLETREKLEALAKVRNFFRATPEQRTVGQKFLPNEPAFQQESAHGGKKLVKSLVRGSRIDDLAMLGLLYREALLSFALDDALFLRQELTVALARFCLSLRIPSEHRALFELLVERRLIRNRWDAVDLARADKLEREVDRRLDMLLPRESDFRRNVRGTRKRRSRKTLNFSLLVAQESGLDVRSPWVPFNSKLQHFVEHYEVFQREHARRTALEHISDLKKLGMQADSRLIRRLQNEIESPGNAYETVSQELKKLKP
ncbi:MAG TPA: hypothetical protein VNI53_01070 [Gammaproteobacteria bacterium]|nr:hypothetical protein [Gammaproteobacteria bacterium]